MSKECPYCNSQLIRGFIYGGKLSFTWYSEDAGFLARNTVFGGETLKEDPKVWCHRCKECNKIIIDLNE